MTKVSFDTAVDKLRAANLRALVYTSPSHTNEKPRWRILLPASAGLPPAGHKRLVARVNGVLGGIIADESFTLSLPYYYGKIGDNPDHQAVIVDGDFIDLRDDLDATAIGKVNGAWDGTPREPGDDPEADPALIAAALAVIPNNDLSWKEWISVGLAVWRATDGNGFELFNEWSKKSTKHDAIETQRRWDHFFTSPPTRSGAGPSSTWPIKLHRAGSTTMTASSKPQWRRPIADRYRSHQNRRL